MIDRNIVRDVNHMEMVSKDIKSVSDRLMQEIVRLSDKLYAAQQIHSGFAHIVKYDGNVNKAYFEAMDVALRDDAS